MAVPLIFLHKSIKLSVRGISLFLMLFLFFSGLLSGCASDSSDPSNTNPVMISEITVDSDTLVSGDTTSISVSLQYNDLTPYEVATNIYFSASCPSSSFSPVVAATSGGTATATYTAGTCAGTDIITAAATVNGEEISMTRFVSITVPSLNLLFGRGSGASFEQGMLESGTGSIGDGQFTLSAGGNTTITATIVDADNSNALYSAETVDISFSSPCAIAGTATINSPVMTVGGVATTTYTANGCVGDDVITAAVTVNASVYIANVTLTVAPTSVNLIEFISASDTKIAIADSGSAPELSVVTFKVSSSTGDPVQNQTVNFNLNTIIGGISLSQTSDTTDVNGYASTVLQSGTIYTDVRVNAFTTDVNSGITYSTQSAPILITSLMTDAEKFTLSVVDCNPGGAYESNGVTVDVSVTALDYFDEFVPDGTIINFITEGGSIDGTCQTYNGSCAATWTSQEPRPAESGQEGRSSILAYVVGSETFDDVNANQVYDDADPDFRISHTDLPEAWLDSNENGSYDAATEEFLDFDSSGTYTGADDRYTGVLCQRSPGFMPDCGPSGLYVSQSAVIHMASNNNSISIDGGNGNNVDFNLPLSTDTPLTVTIVVNSATGQYPATGTSVTVETTNGTIVSNANFDVPDNCNATPGQGYEFTVDILGDGTGDTGTLTVTTTSNAVQSQQSVNVADETE